MRIFIFIHCLKNGKATAANYLKLEIPNYYNMFYQDTAFLFVRKEKVEELQFDAVVYVRDLLMSTINSCPESFMYINRDGTAVFWSRSPFPPFNIENITSTQLSKARCDSMFNNFRYLNLNKITNEYHTGTLGFNIKNVILFLKDHKIVKGVLDMDEVSPDELRWGYIPLSQLNAYTPSQPLARSVFDKKYANFVAQADSITTKYRK